MVSVPPPQPAVAAPGTSGKATAALVLGILGLVGGMLAVPLLLATLGNVYASLALQEIDASGGRLGGRGLAVAGIACATAALVLWVMVFIIVAIVAPPE